MNRLFASLCLASLCFETLSGCSSGARQSAVDAGRALFDSKALSPSHLNAYACASCHDADPLSPASKKAGAPLAGVTLRPQFWGGQVADLLGAVNACRNYFMLANDPLTASDHDAQALYAYLESLEPGDPAAVPFHVVTSIEDVPRGNAPSGQILFAEACTLCHGDMHHGSGRLGDAVPILPEDTIREHAEFTPRVQRLIFIEKMRHGRFLGYGGVMPPFSSDVLSDPDVSDLLEALGMLGE